MKKIFGLICLVLLMTGASAQITDLDTVLDRVAIKPRLVEASCGSCNFGMKMPGCFLAVRIDGKAYVVDGEQKIDAYGDAHGKEGMCNAIRKAEVIGEIKNDRFVATSFKLLPVTKAGE